MKLKCVVIGGFAVVGILVGAAALGTALVLVGIFGVEYDPREG